MKFLAHFTTALAVISVTLLAASPTPASANPSPAESPPPSGEIVRPFIPIPEKFIPAYFGKRPESYLIDPQKLLSPSDFRDRLAFLNYHASDSAIDLFVFVIGADQEIPAGVKLDEIIGRFFSNGRPAVIVFYYPNSVQRSTLLLSPSIANTIPQTEQRRILESAVMQANRKSNVSEQTEQFLVQVSIRIYWMEQMISGKSAKNDKVPHANLNPALSKSAAKAAGFAKLQEVVMQLMIPAAAAFVTLVIIALLVAWRRLTARHFFPVHQVETRLGGNHAAGVGAVITFASTKVPPASQREQVSDFSRRF
ncbi:MAG: hypothetical protein QE267_05580 [Akkermansiaceae bacterium]|nr:hypothetical protein [Akkermansiaceae bacterium]